MQNNFRFSVIICTYNRERYVSMCLESIASQDYPHDKYEIVVVNNNSTDNTEKVCEQFRLTYPDIAFKYIVETRQGVSYSRNTGTERSDGELLLYVDDDATVCPGYLKAYDEFFLKYPDRIAAGGPIIPFYESEPPGWLSYYTKVLLTAYLYKGKKIIPFRFRSYPGGGNSCFRIELTRAFELYRPELGRRADTLTGGEEKDFYARLRKAGITIWYIPEAGIYHHIPARKLTEEHFKKLTYSMGASEKTRTQGISKYAYLECLFLESLKWGASFILFFYYCFLFQYPKGKKLLEFRYNLTKGLLGIKRKQ